MHHSCSTAASRPRLQRTVQADHETIHTIITDISAKLDVVLEAGGGYSQNKDKLVLQPTFVGTGSHEHYRKSKKKHRVCLLQGTLATCCTTGAPWL